MDADQRVQRKQIHLLQDESVWLQKALFALRKAQDSAEKLYATREEEAAPYTLPLEDDELSVDAFEAALEARIATLLDKIRDMRRALR
jgi:hypothetical protein